MGQRTASPGHGRFEAAVAALVGVGLGAAWHSVGYSGDFKDCVPFAIAAITGALLAARDLGLWSNQDSGDNGAPPPPPQPPRPPWRTPEGITALTTIATLVWGIVSTLLGMSSDAAS